jgi:plastocyanin
LRGELLTTQSKLMDILWERIQDLWNAILDLTAKLVIPDWAGLVALIPIGLAALVALFFAVVIVRFATAGPKRRGKRRIEPIPPPGVHAGGTSIAPFLAAIGLFLAFAGFVVGGIGLVLGFGALILTLLYWGREAISDYDHVEPPLDTRVVVVPQAPPPGVHMPGPSFRPLLGALGAAAVFAGLVVKGWVLIAGILILIITLVGWLTDARREYVATIEADETGHLPTAPPPRYPVKTIALAVVILVVAVVVNAGILPPSSSAGGAAGGSPGASGAAPAPPAAQSAAPSGPAADVTIVAKDIAFQTQSADAPAGKPFTIAFENQDPQPHNVAIHKDSATGQQLFMGEIVQGPKTVVYNVPALPAGSYAFVCSVHPNMTGTLSVK